MTAALAISLAAAVAVFQSSGDAAFETAKRREFLDRSPTVVLMLANRGTGEWETVAVYGVARRAMNTAETVYLRQWVVRRDWQDGEDDSASQNPPAPPKVETSWIDSRTCPGVTGMLEAIEQIQPVPYDLAWVGSDYDGPILVGGAKIRFWLVNGPMTPMIETEGDGGSARWYLDADIEQCWTPAVPPA